MTYRHAWMERRPEMSVNNSAFAFALRLFVGRCRVGELNQPWLDYVLISILTVLGDIVSPLSIHFSASFPSFLLSVYFFHNSSNG